MSALFAEVSLLRVAHRGLQRKEVVGQGDGDSYLTRRRSSLYGKYRPGQSVDLS